MFSRIPAKHFPKLDCVQHRTHSHLLINSISGITDTNTKTYFEKLSQAREVVKLRIGTHIIIYKSGQVNVMFFNSVMLGVI